MPPDVALSPFATATQMSFTTSRFRPELRAQMWEDYCRRWFTTLRCRAPLRTDFRMAARCTRLTHVDLAEFSGDGSIAERTPDLIRSAPCERLTLGIVLRGTAFINHASGSDVLATGDAILYDPDSPAVYGFSDGFGQLNVCVSREIYGDRLGLRQLSEPRIVRTASGDPIRAHIEALFRIARAPLIADLDEAGLTETSVLDLCELIVGGTGRASSGYWLSAREHIRRNLQDPGLSVQHVSHAIGISQRHLARVFADHSTSVSRVIAEERMRRAHDLLTDPTRQALTISQVALLSGFVSASHFSQAFRRAFGCSASELRGAQSTKCSVPKLKTSGPLPRTSFEG